MKKLISLGFIFILAFALMAFKSETATYSVGDTIENFTLFGIDGKPYNLYDQIDQEGTKAVMIMLVSWRCPVSNNCNDRMNDLQTFCAENGITFLGMNPNSIYYDGSNEKIREEADKAGFKFPILRDINADYADKFKMAATPTAILINKDRTLLYRGRIDDQHGRAGQPQKPIKEHTLMNALNEFLAGKELTINDTRSVGCSIKRDLRYYKAKKAE